MATRNGKKTKQAERKASKGKKQASFKQVQKEAQSMIASFWTENREAILLWRDSAAKMLKAQAEASSEGGAQLPGPAFVDGIDDGLPDGDEASKQRDADRQQRLQLTVKFLTGQALTRSERYSASVQQVPERIELLFHEGAAMRASACFGLLLGVAARDGGWKGACAAMTNALQAARATEMTEAARMQLITSATHWEGMAAAFDSGKNLQEAREQNDLRGDHGQLRMLMTNLLERPWSNWKEFNPLLWFTFGVDVARLMPELSMTPETLAAGEALFKDWLLPLWQDAGVAS